jgi:hypothetical protein
MSRAIGVAREVQADVRAAAVPRVAGGRVVGVAAGPPEAVIPVAEAVVVVAVVAAVAAVPGVEAGAEGIHTDGRGVSAGRRDRGVRELEFGTAWIASQPAGADERAAAGRCEWR